MRQQLLVAVAVAEGEGGEALVVPEVGALEDGDQPLPELLLGAADDQPAVAGWNAWKGTSEGWAESTVRTGSYPAVIAQVAG